MNHGGSPNTVLDIVLSIAALFIVIWAFYLAVRYTLRPGETSQNHIKRRVLDDTDEPSS